LRIRAPDIQAAMAMLGRRAVPPGSTQPLLLARTDLRRADLAHANLKGADLVGANLEGAYLSGANLEGACLSGANLEGARATPDTSWPNGFNWKDAKLHMEE
jgi:uncharacterized protein YjbI with pentapeptide repeats